MHEIKGFWEIEFVGDPELRNIDILHPVVNQLAHILYLVAVDGTIYNWSTIIRLKKSKFNKERN